jgi:hypothetical protein
MSEVTPNPASGTPPGATPPAATPPASTATDWTSNLNPDMKGFVQNKGFKDPASVLESYVNLEKLIGAKEKLIKLPDNMDDPAALKEIFGKLGLPEKSDEYGFEIPKEPGDAQDFVKWAKDAFHESGLTKKQATTLAEKWTKFFTDAETNEATAYKSSIEAQQTSLKKEWGAAYEQKIAAGRSAASALGVTGEQVDALEKVMGFEATMKFMDRIGSKIMEPGFAPANPGSANGHLTPEQALNRKTSLMADADFRKRYLNGDTGAREEMERLHKYMAT